MLAFLVGKTSVWFNFDLSSVFLTFIRCDAWKASYLYVLFPGLLLKADPLLDIIVEFPGDLNAI